MINQKDKSFPIIRAMHEALSDPSEGKHHIEFINNRPFKNSTLKQWMIGFCPPHVLYKQFPYIRGRIITPIWDAYGNLVSLAGRKIEALSEEMLDHFTEDFGSSKGIDLFNIWDRSKWINEPYDKHKHLYGLNITKENILAEGYALILEGNFSVVSLWDHGVKNAVATCGTSISPDQISLLSRYTQKLVIITDADDAGSKAAERFIEILESWSDNIQVMAVALPEGYDPEDYVRQFGGQRIKHSIGQSLKAEARISELTLISNATLGIGEED